MPKVSVLIPVYNVEKYIKRCMVSIQQQTLSDIEIVVVNDCTPDNSMVIVQELAKDDQRIKILNHDKNMGLMWTRRTGYMAATGDYVTFCDSDDYMPSVALEKLYLSAVESNADIVSGNAIYSTVTGKDILIKNELKYGVMNVCVLKSLLRHELSHTLWGKMFKVSLLKDFNYHIYEHATNGEDGCLFYQVVTNSNKTILIDDIVYYYMQNLESSTQLRYNENAIKSICILNQTRDNIVSSYPELYADLNRCVTTILCGLYVQGYNNENTNLCKHIKERGLEHYVSFSNIVMYLNYVQTIKAFLRNRRQNHK